MEVLQKAADEGRSALSEYESKQVLEAYHIPITRERTVTDEDGLRAAMEEIGFPLVLKGCSSNIAHKTGKGLIKVDIRNVEEALDAFQNIVANVAEDDEVLVQEMIKGQRELVVGLTRDPQFGPCVMFGLGGIFTEVLKDISFRVAPLEKHDALEMMSEIKAHKILDAVRGMPAADRDLLADILINVGRIGLENDAVKEIDINPLILSGSKPVAVDALVVLE
ncbi:MAG: ATP-grasp domain-containing protein [Deltaproteobacteria bacterium]|nr:ATP-grasp domain-containing protein [Deltaproteobacteria bacterium]